MTNQENSHPISYYEDALKKYKAAANWFWSRFNGEGFTFTDDGYSTIISTSISVLALEGFGELKEDNQNWLAVHSYLKNAQDPSTGFFADKLLKEFPLHGKNHDVEYLQLQMTYYALQALDALGSKPLYPLLFIQPFYQPGELITWLESLDWSNPWLESNRIMFVLAILIYQAEVEKNLDAPRLYFEALDWLNQKQDSKTGLWGTDSGASFLNAVAAAYHFLPFFEYVHRPFRGMQKIVDAGLDLQQADGLFSQGLGGGACEDEDVIDILTVITKKISYRREEIRNALTRSFWALWNLQNSDGGFGYANRSSNETYCYSSWEAMKAKINQSDSWSTWFRFVSLATIQASYPKDLPDLGQWTFRRWPALGYHRFNEILSNEEAAKIPIWAFKDLSESNQGNCDNKPMVSVVIPYYNMGRYLPETLKSIFSQTFQDFEVILVDDGSSDNYSKVSLDYLDHPNIKIIRQPNQGVASARNHGIRFAAGEFICCIDPDDLYHPAFFQKAIHEFNNHPEVGMVTTNYQLFDEKQDVISIPTCQFPELLVENRAMVSSMFRREAWEKVGGYDQSLQAMQDWDFWIKIIESGYKAKVIPEILFQYRVRSNSMYQKTKLPENYSSIFSAIVQSHKKTYLEWFDQLMKVSAEKNSQLMLYTEQMQQSLAWAENQKSALEKLVTEKDQKLLDQGNWIAELEKGKQWLEDTLAELRDYIKQQDQTKEDLALQMKEQSSYIEQQEAAKEWLEGQRVIWMNQFLQKEKEIQEISQKHERITSGNLQLMAFAIQLNVEKFKTYLKVHNIFKRN